MYRLAVSAAACSLAATASAELYTDAAGDIVTGNANLDLVSAEITNDDDNLFVSIVVSALDGDWGKYVMMFDVDGDGGDSTNPWGRSVDTPNGIDGFIGSWVDGGGGGLSYSYDGSAWNSGADPSVTVDFANNTINYTISLAALGMSLGDTFAFDIGSTGGTTGDPMIDTLGADVQPGWGNGSSSNMDLSYTVVPAPGALALLGLAVLAGRRRRG